jgi:AraC-like DNA-binding protein
VGYADVTFFRGVFKRFTGLAPGAYRRRFAGITTPGALAAGREDAGAAGE